jgi:histidinol-phosphate aminotransferase
MYDVFGVVGNGASFTVLKEAGIYVRHWNDPKIKDYLRITIGTDEEMKIFLDFLKKKIGA